MNDLIYSIVEFLGQPLVIIFFIAIIFFLFMFRITGAEKIWNEKKIQAQKDNLESERLNLERKKIARELEKEEQITNEEAPKNEPNVIYIKEEKDSDYAILIILLIILLLISLYFNYQQYQELQQYKQIMGEIKNGISIFQQFLE